jgi:dephospho-CoA kinase
MKIIGLTGSIAMGKSYVARLLIAYGVPVFDADACVREMMAPGGTGFAAIAKTFDPSITAGGKIDRIALGKLVFSDKAAKSLLEGILHPMVRRHEDRFLKRCRRMGEPVAVLDIPLLFETGGERRVDYVAVVQTHPSLREARAMRRPGMTKGRLSGIVAAQMGEAEKARRADMVITSGFDRGETGRQIVKLLHEVTNWSRSRWYGERRQAESVH